jgi:hypothetical protein
MMFQYLVLALFLFFEFIAWSAGCSNVQTEKTAFLILYPRNVPEYGKIFAFDLRLTSKSPSPEG